MKTLAEMKSEGPPKKTRVKICGITNINDALLCIDEGADAVGFVNVKSSPRYVRENDIRDIILQLQEAVVTVMVSAGKTAKEIVESWKVAGTDAVQVHSELSEGEYAKLKDSIPMVIGMVPVSGELPSERIKEVSQHADAILFDTKVGGKTGGTGKTFDWKLLSDVRKITDRPVIVAGGLKPSNVSEVVRCLHPFAVDTSSGVEDAPGKKNKMKVRRFIMMARQE